jgi:hypothetical protein
VGDAMQELNLAFPEVSDAQRRELGAAKRALDSE